MSCKILLDLNDSPSNCQNNLFKRHNRFGQNCSNILAFIGRALYFRPLKLLKVYMAAIVVILILFILFRPEQATHEQLTDIDTNIISQNDQIKPKNDNLKNLNPVHSVNIKSQHQHEHDPSNDDKYLSLLGQATYPNNLSYSLTMRDFSQMKNINVMQVRIREAMKHSWDNYRRYAWGYDMLKPRSKEADHWFNLGLTIVEAADTLIMMGLNHDASLALEWIENELKFKSNSENSNCFELTIRILAGILSAYHLTAREKLKQQAIDVGNILLHCYDTESKVVPYSDIDLNSHRAHPPQWNPHSSLSEVTSLQLEFRYLSQISANPIYEQTTFRTSTHIHNLTTQRQQKLLPMYISPSTGELEESIITLGARADSYYEYLLKQYLQTGIKWLADDYLDCVDEIESRLMRYTNGEANHTYIAEMQIYKTANDTEDIKYYNKMDHLVCFLPGTLALGYYHFSPLASEYRLKYNLETPTHKLNSRFDGHLKMAQSLGQTCYHMYSNMGTGLAPEIALFIHVDSDNPLVQNQPELQAQSSATHNILRPEFVESLFYLYHITGLPMYRQQATQVFDAFQKYSRILTGYSPISDVREKPPSNANLHEWLHKYAPDRMESFWLSETLKYLYLIFCDDRRIIGTLLNHYVFNTEAHIIPVL